MSVLPRCVAQNSAYIRACNASNCGSLKCERNGHCGYVESRHKIKECDTGYYERCVDYPCYKTFCDNLKSGGYIPCGCSGGSLYLVDSFDVPRGYLTCGFVYGQDCAHKKLWRRWTCCGQRIYGTMDDIKNVQCNKHV